MRSAIARCRGALFATKEVMTKLVAALSSGFNAAPVSGVAFGKDFMKCQVGRSPERVASKASNEALFPGRIAPAASVLPSRS